VRKRNMDVAAQPIETLEYLASRRRSCRAFKQIPVARESILRILSVAQKTASWCNSQPWRIIITSGGETVRFREAMYKAASSGVPQRGDFSFPREYRGVYAERRRESGFQLYNALNIPRGDKLAYARQALENFNFFGAPHVAVVTTDEAFGVYGAVDCGAYVANFLLAAEASGVAAVPQASLAFYSDVVREHFGLGSDRKILCGISFGIADAEHPANSFRTSRAELAEVVSFVGD
jgi:nitroreductase